MLNAFSAKLAEKHKIIPRSVGIKAAAIVHLRLPLSFFIVINVVAQGQWKSENSKMHKAVVVFQPLDMKSSRSSPRLVKSTREPQDV